MSQSFLGRALRLLVLSVSFFGLSLATVVADDTREQRVFTVEHRGLDEVYLAIADLIGDEGEVSLSKAQRRLKVTDEPARLTRIALAIAAFDVPPRRVKVTLRLVRAEKRAQPEGEPIKGVPPNLRDLVRFNIFDELGEVVTQIDELGSKELELGQDFRATVRLGKVNAEAETIYVRKLSLLRRQKGRLAQASFRVLAEYKELLRSGRSHIVGYTGQSGSKALFVFVTAEIVE